MTPHLIKISRERVERFREIYRQQFGEDVSYADAEQKGKDLIIIVLAILERKHKSSKEGGG